MPLYEYHCNHCETDFELLIMGSEQAICPSCEKPDVEKLLSVTSAPSMNSRSLPINQSCGMPRCCGGGCNE